MCHSHHHAIMSGVDGPLVRFIAGAGLVCLCLLAVACGTGQGPADPPATVSHQHDAVGESDVDQDVFLGRVKRHFPDMLVDGPPSVVEQDYQKVFKAVAALQDWYDNSTDQTDETLQAVMEEAGFSSFEALDEAAGRLAEVLEFRGRLQNLDHFLQYPPVKGVLIEGQDDDSAPAFADRLPELRDNIATIYQWVEERGYTTGDVEHVDQHEVAIRNFNRMHSALYQVRGIRQMR